MRISHAAEAACVFLFHELFTYICFISQYKISLHYRCFKNSHWVFPTSLWFVSLFSFIFYPYLIPPDRNLSFF